MKVKQENEVLSPKSLYQFLGMSRKAVDDINRSDDPLPRIQLSPRRIGYFKGDVLAWLERRKAATFTNHQA